MKKKKVTAIIIIVLIVVLAAAAGVFFMLRKGGSKNEGVVYVESVADLTGAAFAGDNRYMGIVESQEVKSVAKDSDKKVKAVYVEVEDAVKTGDKLFEYDTDEMTLKLRQLELELTSINNGITTMNQQIANLVAERDQAPAENKLEYTAQIQNIQAQINQSNYDASAKQLEIDRQSAAIQNSIVYSPMDGIIKEINDDSDSSQGGNDMNMYGEEPYSNANGFISIMAKGDYRVKGTASEMNVRGFSEGQPVIVRSRLDDSVIWRGTITKIDLEHPDNGNNDGYYYGGGGETASKYPFYIDLETIDGLMLGQHVYIEMDYGQGEVREGLWLDEFYIMQESDGSYVWAEDSDGRIEKRRVELGEYDENLMRYQILSGISEKDYIAYPEERIKEGMKTTHNYEDVIFESGNEGMTDDGMMDDGMMEDGVTDDGMMEDGMTDDGMMEDGMIDDGNVDDTDLSVMPLDESGDNNNIDTDNEGVISEEGAE